MAAVQQSRNFVRLDADQAYHAADQALAESGFDIWKKRPLGWLLMANKEVEKGTITGNAACRPGTNSVVTFTLECPAMTEEELQETVDHLFAAVEQIENA